MYFDHAPKHMIRLSVKYRQDSKIPIRLWKSLVGDTPNIYICVCVCVCVCVYTHTYYIHIYIYSAVKSFLPTSRFFIFFANLSHLSHRFRSNKLILHKDNASKYKMQFLNDYLKKSCPNLLGPMWKMNCPLLLNHERTVINHIILESWVKFH